MKILKLEALPTPYHCEPKDQFNLRVNGKVVHIETIKRTIVITHFALVELEGGSLGYFIGDKSLITDLSKLIQ